MNSNIIPHCIRFYSEGFARMKPSSPFYGKKIFNNISLSRRPNFYKDKIKPDTGRLWFPISWKILNFPLIMILILKALKQLLTKMIIQKRIAVTNKVRKRMIVNLLRLNQIRIHKRSLRIKPINNKRIFMMKKLNGSTEFLITVISNRNLEVKWLNLKFKMKKINF